MLILLFIDEFDKVIFCAFLVSSRLPRLLRAPNRLLQTDKMPPKSAKLLIIPKKLVFCFLKKMQKKGSKMNRFHSFFILLCAILTNSSINCSFGQFILLLAS